MKSNDNRLNILMDHNSSLPSNDKGSKPFKNLDGRGHRNRMRSKILSRGTDVLEDYEILEMLLYSFIPRKDTKPLAKQLINQHGSLWHVIKANTDRIDQIIYSKRFTELIQFIQLVALRLCMSDLIVPTSFKRLNEMVVFLEKNFPKQDKINLKSLRIIYLNSQYNFIKEYFMVYPSKNSVATILKKAIENDATQIVLVHYVNEEITPDMKYQIEQFSKMLQSKVGFFDLNLSEHLFCVNHHYVSILK